MSLARSKSFILAFQLAATLLAGTATFMVADAAAASKPAPPKLSGLHARIGKGGTVDLAASNLTTAELAALRPDYEKLKPRARSNAE